MHDAGCEPLLIGSARVQLRLLQRLPAEPTHELMRACASFSECRRSGLAKPVRRALGQPGLVTAVSKPVAKSSRCEAAAILCDKEREVASRTGRKDALQRR